VVLDHLPWGPEVGDLPEGEGHRTRQGDFVPPEPSPVPKVHFEVRGPQFQGPDLDLDEPVELQVAHPVLEADGHAFRIVAQGAVRIKLPENQWRNHTETTCGGSPNIGSYNFPASHL